MRPLQRRGADMLLLRQTSSDVGHHVLISSSTAGGKPLRTVCRFYASNARFLAIYMQHIAGSIPDAHRFLHDIAAALAYIHGQGIQHNNLKPDNIVISETAAERHAVLIDIGIETMVGTRSTGAGSPWHRGPFVGDVWSLGAIGLFLRRLTPLPEAPGAGWTISHLY
ncbi:hypothetical protein B0T18DRAFT_444868 [Schizothecium vesticola]|uniref:Protein kinase domain-containing protein n=1 Tax=Schizothecium vesticola TaxID=314040 RepID=A0AA40F8F9_9PEZI|nr:hypothetical protein B0T18DRAFT_444868 [Schizothecium vesticola]